MAADTSTELAEELSNLRSSLLHKIRLDDSDPDNIMALINTVWTFLAKHQRDSVTSTDLKNLEAALIGYKGVYNSLGGVALAKENLLVACRQELPPDSFNCFDKIEISCEAWRENICILREKIPAAIADKLAEEALDIPLTNLQVAIGLGLCKEIVQANVQLAKPSSPSTARFRAQSSPELGRFGGAASLLVTSRTRSSLVDIAEGRFDGDDANGEGAAEAPRHGS